MKTDNVSDLQTAWWKAWWKRDYSWNGLAKIRVSGWYLTESGQFTRDRSGSPSPRPATLQDVWRGEETRLYRAPNGAYWTVIHVPFAWQDGTPAKSKWKAANLIAVEQAIETAALNFPVAEVIDDVDGDKTKTTKPRLMSFSRTPGLPMDGAVLRTLPDSWLSQGYLRGDRIAIGEANFPSLTNLHLRMLLVEEDLSIYGVEEGRQVRFSNAIVRGSLYFSDLVLDRIQLFRMRCFDNFTIESIKSPYGISIQDSRIKGAAVIDEIVADSLSFVGSNVSDNVVLNDIRADLDLSNLSVDGSLQASKLNLVDFDAAGFRVDGEAAFDECEVTGVANFSGSSWGRTLRFNGARLGRPNFEDVEFTGKATFEGSIFEGPVSFARAHFKNTANFQAVTWRSDSGDHDGAFRETRFDSFVDFQKSDFRAFAAFDGATFKGEIRFDRSRVADDKMMNAVVRGAATDQAKLSLEHGFRALKQAAEGVRDRHLEQTFFRYELITRRHQDTTPDSERLLSFMYGLCSNYGASFVRPLTAATFVWVLFFGVYLALGRLSGAPELQNISLFGGSLHPSWSEALSLSTRSMFNLFGIWNVRVIGETEASSVSQAFEFALLRDYPAITFATKLLSSVQSLISGVLLFLLALAARRKFQIS